MQECGNARMIERIFSFLPYPKGKEKNPDVFDSKIPDTLKGKKKIRMSSIQKILTTSFISSVKVVRIYF